MFISYGGGRGGSPVRRSAGGAPALRRAARPYAPPLTPRRGQGYKRNARRKLTSACARRRAGGENADKTRYLSADVPDDYPRRFLRERVAAGVAGAGVSARQTAAGGVQIGHQNKVNISGVLTGGAMAARDPFPLMSLRRRTSFFTLSLVRPSERRTRAAEKTGGRLPVL